MISDDPSDKPPCRGCSSYLTEPYIKCAECGPSPFLLCLQVNRSQKLLNLPADKPSPTETKHFVSLQCFTRGFEYKKHQSDHKYEIMVSEIKKQTNKQIKSYPVWLSFNINVHLSPRYADVRFPRAGAWVDSPGRDGPA